MIGEDLARIHGAAFVQQRPWSVAEFADLLASPHVFVETTGAAFALGRVIAGEAELLTLACIPEAQSQGLGRQVLQRFHNAAAQRNADTAFLEVAANNDRAIRLYESEGYLLVANRRDYYQLTNGQRMDARIYRRQFGA